MNNNATVDSDKDNNFKIKCRELIKVNKELQLKSNQIIEELNNERNEHEKEITKITKTLHYTEEKLDNAENKLIKFKQSIVFYLIIQKTMKSKILSNNFKY